MSAKGRSNALTRSEQRRVAALLYTVTSPVRGSRAGLREPW